jgi:hypothetical protein
MHSCEVCGAARCVAVRGAMYVGSGKACGNAVYGCKGVVMWPCSCKACSDVVHVAVRCMIIGCMQGMWQCGTCGEWGSDVAM